MSRELGFRVYMTRSLVWVMLLFPILGCRPDAKAPEETSQSEVTVTDDTSGVALPEFGIGDVETSIEMTLSLNPDMDLTNVQYHEAQTKQYRVAKVEATVSKPYPEKMLLTLKYRIGANFTGHAVQVFPHIFLDDKDIPLEGFILGGNAVRKKPEFTIDVFEYMDTIPSKIVAHPRSEIVLFLDTDESEITVETPPTELSQSITKLGNPVRIDFLP